MHPIDEEQADALLAMMVGTDTQNPPGSEGGLAAMFYAFCTVAKSRKTPEGDIYLVATADEESGGLGASSVAEQLPLDTAYVYIGEPTGNALGIASKGTLWTAFDIAGRTAHGAYPEHGINAIDAGFLLYQATRQACGQTEDSLLGQATCTATKIEGGVKDNMVADRCRFQMDIRTVPSFPNSACLAMIRNEIEKLEARQEGLRIEMTVRNDRPAVAIDEGDPAARLIREAYRSVTGEVPACKGIRFFSDASVFIRHQGDVRCVQFGPGMDSNAHISDEYVDLDMYHTAVRCYTELLAGWYGRQEMG